jgi:acetyltransferase-like isoleucine patch superfamily enzyme
MFNGIKFRIFNFFEKNLADFRLVKIKINPNVNLGANVVIKSSSIIETKYGGNIYIGEKTEILDGVSLITYGGDIVIGRNCSINPYSIIYGIGNTKIGNNVLIAGHCMIIPNNHKFSDRTRPIAEQGCEAKGIIIEDDVWIGHGCSILDGVIIGKGSVIAAGSVVNKSVEAYSIMAGVPAKKIKSR